MIESKFIDPLHVEQISERDWKLIAPFRYDSCRLNRRVTVVEGFVTDFSSVPRLPLTYFLTGGIACRAAVLHDWFYRNGEYATRRDADGVFYEAMRLVGYWWWRCFLMWLGLRLFGWANYQGINPATSMRGNARAQADQLRNIAAVMIEDKPANIPMTAIEPMIAPIWSGQRRPRYPCRCRIHRL